MKDNEKELCLYRCGEMFLRLDFLKRHMKMHHGQSSKSYQEGINELRCPVPGFGDAFASRKGLFMHTRMIHGSRISRCEHCRSVFKSQAELSAHLLCVH